MADTYVSTLPFAQFKLLRHARSAEYGGAVYIAGTSANSVTLVNVTNTVMESNTAHPSASEGAGGALYLDGGVTSMSNNTFRWNSAGSYGGALAYIHACFNFSSVPGQLKPQCNILPSCV